MAVTALRTIESCRDELSDASQSTIHSYLLNYFLNALRIFTKGEFDLHVCCRTVFSELQHKKIYIYKYIYIYIYILFGLTNPVPELKHCSDQSLHVLSF